MKYTTEELQEIIILSFNESFINECISYNSNLKETQNPFEVLEVPLRQVPLHLNDPREYIRRLAGWRLEHNK
jgi:hypothetical protein